MDWQNGLLFGLVFINAWGITNGGILLQVLWKRRGEDKAHRAIFESTVAMSLNAASWAIILASTLLWPPPTQATGTGPQQVLAAFAFVVASLGISYALHRMRGLLAPIGAA